MKVTIQSVADRAAVSIGTVSRVLNHDPAVSPELSRRVRSSIEELGYRPLRKRTRRSERGGLSGKTIGLLTLGMGRSLSNLPVVTAAIDGLREALGEAGAALQWVDSPGPGVLSPTWKRTRCDGWLIKGAMQGNVWTAAHGDLRAGLEARPCVWFHGRPPGAPGWVVGPDDWEAGVMAATELERVGHRRVAFLSPKADHLLLKRRQQGFVSTCEELGIRCRVALGNREDWTFPLEPSQSLVAVEGLLGELLRGAKRDWPTAIFVPADSIAVLLYRALAVRGLRIPEDMSVISVNREEGLIAGLFPALTTLDVHAGEVGREAVAALSRCFEGGNEGGAGEAVSRDIRIAPSLFRGESVQTLSRS